jgi:cysteinyl-tRNA synthetase
LIFPHHENEIAQSESLTDKTFANYWIHNGFVTINNEKMSKSLGNFFNLKDILEQYEPMVLRLFLLTNHYRKPLDFSDDKLVENTKRFEKFLNFYKLIENLKQKYSEKYKKTEKKVDDYKDVVAVERNFIDAMNNDFNTAIALAELHKLIDYGNRFYELDIEKTFAAFFMLEKLSDILGLNFKKRSIREKKNLEKISSEILELIELRNKARQEKNWAESDRIRNILKEKNIEIKDTKDGTEWNISD